MNIFLNYTIFHFTVAKFNILVYNICIIMHSSRMENIMK